MTGRVTRLSRRTLLADFGTAGIGLIVLSACGGSSGSSDPPSTSSGVATDPAPSELASSDPAPTGTPASASPTDPPVTADSIDPAVDADEQTGSLRLQHVSLGFVSAFVLVRGAEAAVVDTGTADGRDAILAGLDAMSVSPASVRHIVLTHNHGDHIGGLAGLEGDLTGATVHAGAGDIATIQTALPLIEAADGDEIFGMGVIGTPGHTPGSISLFDTDTGILVAGDAINGDGAGGLIGPNPDFTADMATALESVAKLAALAPSTAAFGHGGAPVTDDVAAELGALV